MKKYGRWGRCKADTTKPIKGTKRFHRCKNKADGPEGYCWEPTHIAQRGEVYRQFQLDGVGTANTYEHDPKVKLPEAMVQMGRQKAAEARKKLSETDPGPDPMNTTNKRFNLRLGVWVEKESN